MVSLWERRIRAQPRALGLRCPFPVKWGVGKPKWTQESGHRKRWDMGALATRWYLNRRTGAPALPRGQAWGRGGKAPRGRGFSSAGRGWGEGSSRRGRREPGDNAGHRPGPPWDPGVSGVPALCSRGCCVNPGQPSRVQLGLGKGVLQGSGPSESWPWNPSAGVPRVVGTRRRQKGQGLDAPTSPASRLPPYTPYACPTPPQLSPRPMILSQLTHCPPKNTRAALFI